MINITDSAKELSIPPLLRLGFRPFFLFGSLFSLIAVFLWILQLKGLISFNPINGALWWHGHEMLFGFVAAIVAGFLLTAVQTWTGIPSVKGWSLLTLFTVWLSARLLLLINANIAIELIILVDLLFLPLVAYFLSKPIIKIKQYRNLVFLPIILLMTIANAMSYLPNFGFDESYATNGHHSMILLVVFIVALIGGRVIPMFTANGTKTKKVVPYRSIELVAMVLLFLLIICFLTGSDPTFTGILAGCASLVHLFRSLFWRPWVTLRTPLVWSLHVSMLFIPIGLLMLSVHLLTGISSLSLAMHALTVGVIGGMIIAMMSRVSLGHTGRMLQPKPIAVFSFGVILIAAILRSVLIWFFPEHVINFWLLSGVFWCIAFLSFLIAYVPVLSAPRTDGRPG